MPTPTHYWKFNNSVSDSIGSLNLTLSANGSYGTGILNQDIQWNGTSFAASYSGSSGSLSSASAWTMTCWMKYRSAAAVAAGFKLAGGDSANGGTGNVSLRFYSNAGNWIADDPDGSSRPSTTMSSITNDTWIFVYVQCDMNNTASNGPHIYSAINMGTVVMVGGTGIPGRNSGANNWGGIYFYDSVDDVRFYDSYLSSRSEEHTSELQSRIRS